MGCNKKFFLLFVELEPHLQTGIEQGQSTGATGQIIGLIADLRVKATDIRVEEVEAFFFWIAMAVNVDQFDKPVCVSPFVIVKVVQPDAQLMNGFQPAAVIGPGILGNVRGEGRACFLGIDDRRIRNVVGILPVSAQAPGCIEAVAQNKACLVGSIQIV